MCPIIRILALLVVLLVALTGCARSPEARKAKHLERREKHFQDARYGEAIIELRNALKIEPANLQGIYRLGLAHFQLGEYGQAYRFLLKTQELDPARLDVRQKLGQIYLAARRVDAARAEADYILERNPKNFDALILCSSTVRNAEELTAAIQRLEDTKATFGDRARLYTTLGTLYMAKRTSRAPSAT